MHQNATVICSPGLDCGTMEPQNVHEDTPLLTACDGISQESPKPRATPLSWQQLSVVLLLHLAEPLTSQMIAPFLPQVR